MAGRWPAIGPLEPLSEAPACLTTLRQPLMTRGSPIATPTPANAMHKARNTTEIAGKPIPGPRAFPQTSARQDTLFQSGTPLATEGFADGAHHLNRLRDVL
jgi:hypothetical protein